MQITNFCHGRFYIIVIIVFSIGYNFSRFFELKVEVRNWKFFWTTVYQKSDLLQETEDFLDSEITDENGFVITEKVNFWLYSN